jgi:hypothetical protein
MVRDQIPKLVDCRVSCASSLNSVLRLERREGFGAGTREAMMEYLRL